MLQRANAAAYFSPVLTRIAGRGGEEETQPKPLPEEIAPPLDYAPKRSPRDKGMLDESFGLDEDSNGGEADEPRPPVI